MSNAVGLRPDAAVHLLQYWPRCVTTQVETQYIHATLPYIRNNLDRPCLGAVAGLLWPVADVLAIPQLINSTAGNPGMLMQLRGRCVMY